MSTLLAIGGPRNGDYIHDDGEIRSVLYQDEQGIGCTTNYRRRFLEVQAPDGNNYRRYAYIHEALDPNSAAALLANILIGQWVQGGEKVDRSTSSVVPGGERDGSDPVEAGPSRTPNGLYLP